MRVMYPIPLFEGQGNDSAGEEVSAEESGALAVALRECVEAFERGGVPRGPLMDGLETSQGR